MATLTKRLRDEPWWRTLQTSIRLVSRRKADVCVAVLRQRLFRFRPRLITRSDDGYFGHVQILCSHLMFQRDKVARDERSLFSGCFVGVDLRLLTRIGRTCTVTCGCACLWIGCRFVREEGDRFGATPKTLVCSIFRCARVAPPCGDYLAPHPTWRDTPPDFYADSRKPRRRSC